MSQCDPDELGEKVLAIWNERVAAIRARFRHARTIVLVKSPDLLEASVFEFETILHPADAYVWRWNKNDNLEGFSRADEEHRFTWQPHGSQFTVIENPPDARLTIRLRRPPQLDRETVLRAIEDDPARREDVFGRLRPTAPLWWGVLVAIELDEPRPSSGD